MNFQTWQGSNVQQSRQWRDSVLPLVSGMIVICSFMIASSVAQSSVTASQPIAAAPPQSIISLTPSLKPAAEIVARHATDSRFENAPANYHVFPAVAAGEYAGPEVLTFSFADETRLTGIKSMNKDFGIEPGGTCLEGVSYARGESCLLLVRFNPQGPGPRLGFLRITHSAQSTAANFGLTGNGYAPAISFTPAVITTVPGTYPSAVGLLSGAQNLAIDGGDTLYAADTGNNVIRMLDSSGTWTTVGTTSVTAPYGVAADSFGEVYASSGNAIFETYAYPYIWFQISGSGTDACHYPSTCTLEASVASPSGEAVTNVGAITMDSANNMYFEEQTDGAAVSQILPAAPSSQPSLTRLYDPFTYQTGHPTSFAYSNGYLYSEWPTNPCQINGQSVINAENFYVVFNKVAGGRNCGFSGDGGQARNAEISGTHGQYAFDIAGDFYFADAGNQRVRRIDYNTGVIRTIAGTGTAGYKGDGGGATSANVSNPTGVAVNSQGTVYIISSATSGQVIRQVGPRGFVTFPNQLKGTTSVPQFVTVTNTGNEAMTLTNVAITGANAGDFKIDNTTTTCLLTTGSSLAIGQTCSIGTLFTPSAAGSRSATLSLLDNTVNGADNVSLSGTGVLPAPIFRISAPANGASFPSGTAITFSVSVTSASGSQPTGKVQFKVDGANYGSAVGLSGSGTASTSVTGLSVATHTLSVIYGGDANYAPAGPISVSITVTAAAAVQFTAPLPAASIPSKTAITLAVAVTSTSGAALTGKVTFSVDNKTVGTASVVSGKASVKVAALSAGTHTVAAAYGGDKYHRAARASEKITVSP